MPTALASVRAMLATELRLDPGAVLVAFGWREPTRQTTSGAVAGRRVLLVPQDSSEYTAPRNPGDNPRALFDMLEGVKIYCWGYDGSAANDEGAQYDAARLLHDAVIGHLHRAYHGQFALSDFAWVRASTERFFGAECTFQLTVRARILETPGAEEVEGTSARCISEEISP